MGFTLVWNGCYPQKGNSHFLAEILSVLIIKRELTHESTPAQIAGLRLKAVINGKEVLAEGGDPVISSIKPGTLNISWPLKSSKGAFVMALDEKQISMKLDGAAPEEWFLELTTDAGASLPFQQIGSSRIGCTFESTNYGVTASKGVFSKPSEEVVFRITPQKNTILLNLAGERRQK